MSYGRGCPRGPGAGDQFCASADTPCRLPWSGVSTTGMENGYAVPCAKEPLSPLDQRIATASFSLTSER